MPLTKVTKSLITSVDVSQINTVAGDAGKVLTSDGTSWSAASKITSGTAVTLTNQTSVDFTGIPSTVKRITVAFNGVSLNGSSSILVQIGAGSITNSGYASSSTSVHSSLSNNTSGETATTGFVIRMAVAAHAANGLLFISNISGNSWCSMHSASKPDVVSGGGSVTLSGTLDRVRLTTVNGTDTLDAGTVNIMWE